MNIIDTQYFQIRDNCRKGLLKYHAKAISAIPTLDNRKILDAGCGSGIVSIFLTEKYNCDIVAIDNNEKSIRELKRKVQKNNLENRITIENNSIFKIDLEGNSFDIIIAEGFLNVVGFKKGYFELIKLLKPKGYIIIHDEYPDKNKKIEFIKRKKCKLIHTFSLDENVWWNDYYKKLEIAVSELKDKELLRLFESDLQEIEMYKQDSSQFRSRYYIVEKEITNGLFMKIMKKTLLQKIKDDFKEPHIPLALATGASILIMAYFSKYILPSPIDYLPLAIPPFLMTIYEVVYKKYKDRWFSNPWYWIVAILISTAIVILCYM